ncbi:hypothetical protein KC878_01475 [Candidatus Saccharibacteria bacterium]|nr:hypothetical protein [Candidatus Saccharibacteria bacterium]MCB9821196.1 hypothetical protein [Candidatus Nomurabacteria bacterium]
MDQNSPNPKQQIVEKLKSSENVLVTVSTNPSVDQLAAAIGMTLLLDKLGKRVTAVYSGETPSTIEFLNPEGNLHKGIDSLQDFIISLDASKADKLRYKRDGDVAKIFITPNKIAISEDDLSFSKGDVNVDTVVALGVDQREHLDQAIVAHGRILHDASVLTMMAGNATSDVGSINWQDPAASSLSEMIVSISEAFQSGLLDAQMATAFLTGIVAETDRFKNSKTTPKVMTMSAQLMSAGANQQLIADNLSQPPVEPEKTEPEKVEPEVAPAESEPQQEQPEQQSAERVDFNNAPTEEKKPAQSSDVLNFNMHDIEGNVTYGDEAGGAQKAKADDEVEVDLRTDRIHIDNEGNMQAVDKENPDSNSSENAGVSENPANLGQASTATSPEPEAENQSPEAERHAEGGESFALNKRMKVIQPLPPEPEEKPDATSAPEVSDRTIDDIETRIQQNNIPEADQAVIEPALPVSQDNAREQVYDAIKADLPNEAPEPIKALNAMPLNEGDTEPLSEPTQPQVESTAPPLPPPPIAPDGA